MEKKSAIPSLLKQRGMVKRLIKSNVLSQKIVNYLVNVSFDDEFIDEPPLLGDFFKNELEKNETSFIASESSNFVKISKALLPLDGNLIIEELNSENWIEFATQDRMDDDHDGEFSVIRKHFEFNTRDLDNITNFFEEAQGVIDAGRVFYKPNIRVIREFERFVSLPTGSGKITSHFEVNSDQNTLHNEFRRDIAPLIRLNIPFFNNISLSQLNSVIHKYPNHSRRFGKKLRGILNQLGDGLKGSDGNSANLINMAQQSLEDGLFELKNDYDTIGRDFFVNSIREQLPLLAVSVIPVIAQTPGVVAQVLAAGGIIYPLTRISTDYFQKRANLKLNDFYFLLLVERV